MNTKYNNKADLTTFEIDIANKLIDLLNTKECVSYEELASYFGLQPNHIARHLENIDEVCYKLDIPLISANVVNKGSKQPNYEGFIKSLERCKIDLKEYNNCVNNARRNKDWSKLSEETRRIYNMTYNKK